MDTFIDYMQLGVCRLQVHTYGSIELVDMMPRMISPDRAICEAARISYTSHSSDEESLIKHLIDHEHMSPFEMVEFKFYVVLPIFVARQWVRHRTASINEASGRYGLREGIFYIPNAGRLADLDADVTARYLAYLDIAASLHDDYKYMVHLGVPKELARIGLPVNLYTAWFWKCDLRNILHFLELRLAPAAQQEIRDYAQAMLRLVAPKCPLTMKAWCAKVGYGQELVEK